MLFRCSKPTGKTACAGHSPFTVNTAVGRKLARGRKRVPNVLRMDPTRTAALRRQIETEIKARFKRLKGKVLKLIVDEDAFGLKPRKDGFTGNEVTTNIGRWEFLSDPEKIKAFREWLRSQIKVDILSDEDLWRRYAEMGWKKGAARAFDDVKSPAKSLLSVGDKGLEMFQGTKDEFLRSAFNKPVPTNRIKLLASRSYHDLEGITEQMSTVMTRTLTDGLSQGANPREIARDLVDEVDGLGMARATTMARTEIIRAHAEGQLDSMTELGVTEVGVQVEWNTAGDDAVCPQCEPLEGVVLNIDEARGMLPRHPNCRCAWIPANVGEDDSTQKDTKRQIESAVRASVKAGGEKDLEEGGWGPATDISKTRPTRNEDAILALDEVLLNVFCPTGEGGGVDPTCSLTGGGGGVGDHGGGGVEDFKFYQSPYRITGESFSAPSVDKAGASEISLKLKENPDYLKENPPFQYVKVKKLSIPEKDKEMLDKSAVIKHVDMEELFTSQKFLKPKTVREYMSRIRKKDIEGEIPTVFEHEGKLIIEDGNHKLAAAKLLGIKRVQVKVWDVKKLSDS